ncbi:MAG: outer membrane beta-barrel protein [Candidatus Glassbacteria bacterium]|nr:outer membrane beta-barrel protein [Candidatus Glassbacteria bacterium]
MKKISFLFAFFMVLHVNSLEAQIAGKRWFAEISAGGGKIYGPVLMEKFDLRNTLSLELGYMLTDNIGLIPVAVSFDRFSGFEGFFGDSIRSSVVEFRRRESKISPYSQISWPPLSPPESITATRIRMKSFSYSPGLLFVIPASAELRGYARLGVIYNSSRLYIENTITGNDNFGLKGPHKQSSKNPGYYLGGGIEYVLWRRYALNGSGSYTHIFTGRKGGNPEIDSLDDLEFYFAGTRNEGLKLTSYPGSRDTKIFQFRGGLKIYFGL